MYRDDPPGLMIYLARQYTNAVYDLPDVHPARLADRIVYWLPRTRAP